MIVCQISGQKKDFTTHLYLSDSLLRNFGFINIEENLRRGVRVDAVVLRKIWRYDGDMAGYWWRVGRGRYRRAIKMKITNEKTVSKTQTRVEAAKRIATVSEVRRAVNDHTFEWFLKRPSDDGLERVARTRLVLTRTGFCFAQINGYI